ncbi:MAG: hypothetical protein IPK70_11855 [Flavobacteriales bacterium]|jgi:hypothetical protein|nr:hypothetical protein [Flavobacteriales bacterium]
MLKGGSFVLLFAILAGMVAPSLFVLHFQLHRAYIERELCVQRDVAMGMRTCHGQCQLSKRLKALEQEAAQGFPAERIDFRTEPAVDGFSVPVLIANSAQPRRFAHVEDGLLNGFRAQSDPVPWG